MSMDLAAEWGREGSGKNVVMTAQQLLCNLETESMCTARKAEGAGQQRSEKAGGVEQTPRGDYFLPATSTTSASPYVPPLKICPTDNETT